ncbi:MAG: c-type cytochrome [Pirellulaceae bacterium]|nr:c-type cytochrome [Pirellulaceae bacterium]
MCTQSPQADDRSVRRFIWLALGLLIVVCWGASPARAADPAAPLNPLAPMVIGFERFARHSDLEPLEAGKLLISELSCTACHATTVAGLEPKSGPRLDSAGRRLQAAWMTAYLENPSHTKPGTTMPDVLAGLDAPTKQRTVAALVAYLTSQQTALPELKATGLNPVPHEFWNKGQAENGKRLMHQVGCVTCHEPAADYQGGAPPNTALDQMLEELEPEQIAKLGLTHAARTIPSVPLPNLRDKYTRQGLAMFLFDPAQVRPAGRMPSLKLRTADAADIAAYLMAPSGALSPAAWKQPVQVKLRAEGQRLFGELGCASCHSAVGAKPRLPAKPLNSLDVNASRSCLSATAQVGLPHYGLDELQSQTLSTALSKLAVTKSANSTAVKPDASEQVNLTLLQLNCYACHQRDSRGGVARGRDRFFETMGQVDLGDEGRLPPPLHGVGRKLTTNWLKAVLQGNGDVRPHLQIRMPKYPASEVEPLVPLLAAADAVPPTQGKPSQGKPPTTNVKQELAAAGRMIFDLGCVQCHPIRGESLPSVVGVDVGRIGNRIRREWFHDFLLNPAALKPRTRMPTFFAEGSVNQDILNGQVEDQIEAVWAYLEDIARQPLPEKIEQVRRQNFELVPKDRPVVLRTFMQLAGTHAIAVGFPEHVHYAFDSESVRLAELWGDRFLDAQGTWNDRFAPSAMPLTTNRIPLPTGPDFAWLINKNAPWPEMVLNAPGALDATQAKFLGYRLDKAGVPEFQVQVGDYRIEDRLLPKPGGDPKQNVMIRELSIVRQAKGVQSPGRQLWYRAVGSGKPLQRQGNSWIYASGLTVTLPAQLAATAFSRNAGGQSQVIVPIPNAAETNWSVEYKWARTSN